LTGSNGKHLSVVVIGNSYAEVVKSGGENIR